MRGFDAGKRPRDLFILFAVFALFSVSLYTSMFVFFFEHDKQTVPSTYRRKSRWQELTRLQSLITDLHSELSEAVAERDDLEIQLKHLEGGKQIARSSAVIQAIRKNGVARLRNAPLLGCAHIDAIRIVRTVAVGSMKVVQRGLFGAKEVLIKSVKSEGESVRKCSARMSVGECIALGRYRLLREMSLLTDLRNENVVGIIGRCVRTSDDISDTNTQNLILVTEYGKSTSIEQLQSLSLKQKVEFTARLLDLISFLHRSPLGSLRIEPFNLNQFRIIDDRLKLTHIDSVKSSEPSCHVHSDCIVQGHMSWQPSCDHHVCNGYNLLSNLKGAYSNVFTPFLLVNNDLNEEQIREITDLLNSLLSDRNVSLAFVSVRLRNVYVSEEQRDRAEDEAADRMSLFNDLDTASHQRKEAARQEAAQNEEANKAASDNRDGNVVDGYNQILNADFPGMYDYSCRRTRAKWGCVLAVNGLTDAKLKCDKDVMCKAFVIVPHHSRVGWSTAFFKNGAMGYVNHQGTNVYIKQVGVGVQTGNVSDGVREGRVAGEKDDVFMLRRTGRDARVEEVQLNVTGRLQFGATRCDIDDILTSQTKARNEREHRLMEDMGWPGMTESSWLNLLRNGIVNAVDQTETPPDDSNGGSILVTVSEDQVRKAWFKVEPGTISKRRHIAHIALYYLDRLLGMFQTVPTTGRLLSLQEMQQGHFSSIQKEVKRRFSDLLSHDGTLGGSMSAFIEQEVSVKTRLSVYPDADLAWAVSPLTQQQRNDLEYLIVRWFGRINQTPDQYLSTNGRLVHLDGQMALQQTATDVLPYLNVCQFPRHLVEFLKHVQKHEENGCRLSNQLANILQSDPLHLLPDDYEKQSVESSLTKLDECVYKFLDVAEKCISRFGESIALYN